METLEHLLDVLDYKREVMSQMLLVTTLLAVLAMSGVVAIIATPERGWLRSFLLATLVVSTLAFIFATVLDALMLPGMKRAIRDAAQARALLDLSDGVIWGAILGTVSLLVGIGGLGFLFSRRLGIVATGASMATAITFVVCAVRLAHILR
jgi:hypothetical protein